jgi:beta-lactamase class A
VDNERRAIIDGNSCERRASSLFIVHCPPSIASPLSLAFALFLSATIASADFREFQKVPVDAVLGSKLQQVALDTLAEFKNEKFTSNDIALSVVDLTDPAAPRRAASNGGVPFYPASVVKLFFMTEVMHQVHDGKLDLTPEIQRALREMIHVSDNDATAFLLDVISDTASGPQLSGPALDQFLYRRGVVNRYFAPMGYDISAMAKPWSFGPFGRDTQVVGAKRERRNRMTADTGASLMLWIVRKDAVSPAASEQMMRLLRRTLPQSGDENQVIEFLGESLPPGASEWSKAGWTSEVRNDVAYVELPNGRKFIVAAMTRGIADNTKLLPAISRRLLALFQ